MLTAESWRNWALLERIHDSVWRAKELLQNHVHPPKHLRHQEELAGLVERGLSFVPALWSVQARNARGSDMGCTDEGGGEDGPGVGESDERGPGTVEA